MEGVVMSGAERSIEERLRLIEDYIAIQQLITSYGPAADTCALDELRTIWSDSPVYDARSLAYLEGEQVFEAFGHPFHQSLVAAGSAHTSTMPHIVLDGDKASATHYASLYKHVDGGFELLRLIASRWLLERTAEGWRVYRRINRLLDGSGEGTALLAKVRQPPSEAETT
jgi:hypothetical protein